MHDSQFGLKKGLNQRHIFFIALGSAIGTGLFYGSASAISKAGPSVVLAYIISGAAVFMVMRALGEMAVHKTLPGSFGSYTTEYLGPMAGFITGWTYVFDLALVCVADIIAVSVYMKFWLPDVAPWIWSLGFALIITGLNLCAVKVFGEMEFWLSLIKVAAILAMIAGGLVILIGAYAGVASLTTETSDISNLWKYGGFMPNGISGFLASFAVVVFAFGGIEILGLTACEAKNVTKSIPRAINTVPTRILLFYIMTMLVLMSLFPWNRIGLEGSPFVMIFEKLGISSAAHILNVIVISAAVSAVNSDIYGSSRMMFGLAQDGQAPPILVKTAKNGSPLFAVLIMFCAMLVGIVLNYFVPDQLFFVFAALVTFATVWVWLMIMLSHVRMRLQLSKGEVKSVFPIPLWPVGSCLTIAFLLFVIVLLFIYNISAIYVGGTWVVLLIIAYTLWGKRAIKAKADMASPDK